MKIGFFGHSCFKVSSQNEISVVFDPYEGKKAASPILSADICCVSHNHWDHNAVDRVKATKLTLCAKAGDFYYGQVAIHGEKCYHDDVQGAQRGDNVAYCVNMDSISLCHLGDIGQDLTDDFVKSLGHIDVLMIPVGGVYTIDPQTAVEYVRAIRPRMVIPMHYAEGWFTEVAKLDEFLTFWNKNQIKTIQNNTITFTKEDLTDDSVVVLTL